MKEIDHAVSETENEDYEDADFDSFEQQSKNLFGVNKTYLWAGVAVFMIAAVGYSFMSVTRHDVVPDNISMPDIVQTENRGSAGVVGGGEETEAYMSEVDSYNDQVYSGTSTGHPIVTIQDRVDSSTNIESTFGLLGIEGVPGTVLLEEYSGISNSGAPSNLGVTATAQANPNAIAYTTGASQPYVVEDLVTVMERVNYRPTLTMIKGSPAALERVAQRGEEVSAGLGATEQAVAVSDQPSSRKLFDATTLVYTVSNIALNSDYEGPVWLEVVTAPGKYPELSGAQLLGSAVNLGDKMRLELNMLKLMDGRTLQVNAIGLDLDTTYAAVASDVDYHTLYRYGWWGVGVALGAAGKGAQHASTQVTVSDGVVIQSSEASGRREALIAAGELGRELSNEFKQRLNRPPTVHVDVNETIGVFFLQDVMDGR